MSVRGIFGVLFGVALCNVLVFGGASWWPDAWLSHAVWATYDTITATGAGLDGWSAGSGRAKAAGSAFVIAFFGSLVVSALLGRRARRAGRHAEPSVLAWLTVAAPVTGAVAWPFGASYLVLSVLIPAAVLFAGLALLAVVGGTGWLIWSGLVALWRLVAGDDDDRR